MSKRIRDEIAILDERPSKKLNSTEHDNVNQSKITLSSLLSTNNEPVRRSLASFLDPRSLLALSGTSQELRSSIRENVWNINSRLQFFVEDPIAFRTILGNHQGLISGSFALQFFETVRWDDSDLDLFFEKEHPNFGADKEGSGYQQMITHLVEMEGYSLQSHEDGTETYEHLVNEMEERPRLSFEASAIKLAGVQN